MRYKGTKMAHLQERVGLQQVNEQNDAAARILAEQGFAWKSGWKPAPLTLASAWARSRSAATR